MSCRSPYSTGTESLPVNRKNHHVANFAVARRERADKLLREAVHEGDLNGARQPQPYQSAMVLPLLQVGIVADAQAEAADRGRQASSPLTEPQQKCALGETVFGLGG